MLSENEALLILTGIPLLGPIKIRLLVHHFGSALAALEASSEEVTELPGFSSKIAKGWKNWKKESGWEKNLELVQRYGVKLLAYTSPDYPKRLLEISDAPVLLYVLGEIKSIDQRCIAIVGTRQASIYGNDMAESIARDLAASGFTIVSGLARGIDTSAHKGALNRGRTIGVIGSGLANLYPQENAELARAMTQRGSVVSEYAMSAAPDRHHFPQRNRIVSGMTLATLLIEAPIKSGAMITVEQAVSYGRRVFALPGRVDNENFAGNHFLIKTGRAQLCENAKDIIETFSDLFKGLEMNQSFGKPQIVLESEEKEFWDKLPPHELSIEEIVQLSQLSMMKINVLLMSLKLKKVIKEFPGRIYKKVESKQ